jgi:general secretion pathway protein C
VASNYQLKGIVLAGTSKESIAILSTDGKPAQAIIVNTEVVPGVTLKEVHAQYILLSEGGIAKRVDLPEGVKAMVGEAQLSPISPTGQANPSMPAALTGNSKMRMEESEQEKPNEALSR